MFLGEINYASTVTFTMVTTTASATVINDKIYPILI